MTAVIRRIRSLRPDFATLLLAVAMALLTTGAFATEASAAEKPIAMSAVRDADGAVRIDWRMVPGVYLYRDKLTAKVGGAPVAIATKPGEIKDDPTFGQTEIYHDRASGRVAESSAPRTGVIEIGHQGCAEKGVCYPPTTTRLDLATLAPVTEADAGAEAMTSTPSWSELTDRGSEAAGNLPEISSASAAGPSLDGGLFAVLAAFFGLGLLLSLTPCVYPMVPILAGILARNSGTSSRSAGLASAIAYILAMASAYAALGVAAAWSGRNLQAALQTPLALGAMSLVFVVLAFSMFGVLQLRIPAHFGPQTSGGSATTWVGRVGGAAALGFVSALVVGPCVTPPLAAALLYIAQTGDAARGSAALFALGLGMGVPLLAVGVFGARILPRSGPWLVTVQHAFGAVFLGVAVSLVARVIPPTAALALWALFLIGLGVFVGGWDRLSRKNSVRDRIAKTAGVALSVYGAALIAGAASGATDPLRPLERFATGEPSTMQAASTHRVVTTANELEAVLDDARRARRPILVAFSADWCVICKDNDRAIAGDMQLQAELARIEVVKVDVTAMSSESQKLMSRHQVAGPPTMLMFDRNGDENPGSRTVGAVDVGLLRTAIARTAGA